MSEREIILGRIRDALKAQAPLPGSHDRAPVSATTSTPRQWLPKVGESFDEQLALFARNAATLKVDLQMVSSIDQAHMTLAKMADTQKWKSVATHDGMLAGVAANWLSLPTINTTAGFDVNELETCDVGISECDALIAQTGSVMVTNRSAGGRALSVLPPHHVVLARREQLVADLPAAIELVKKKYANNYPSIISFITGPSRTGDIERILVLGAHGPKKLTIFCL
jgi:L-lactate dehydrogenase complex protein LldG